ncbi:hypothetical protein B0J13DRAFT_546953 [Dactylonectria estremocensis]|uniref:Uncharacterized protein n=1 Tax=Dactylonectria estremocensis TaxID=1079267 RepID=A0A9P9F2Q2_9HYPO|nr:hypothetical protein B0J13DRAFT_546953 [Dactylonectria estremocensis]
MYIMTQRQETYNSCKTHLRTHARTHALKYFGQARSRIPFLTAPHLGPLRIPPPLLLVGSPFLTSRGSVRRRRRRRRHDGGPRRPEVPFQVALNTKRPLPVVDRERALFCCLRNARDGKTTVEFALQCFTRYLRRCHVTRPVSFCRLEPMPALWPPASNKGSRRWPEADLVPDISPLTWCWVMRSHPICIVQRVQSTCIPTKPSPARGVSHSRLQGVWL